MALLWETLLWVVRKCGLALRDPPVSGEEVWPCSEGPSCEWWESVALLWGTLLWVVSKVWPCSGEPSSEQSAASLWRTLLWVVSKVWPHSEGHPLWVVSKVWPCSEGHSCEWWAKCGLTLRDILREWWAKCGLALRDTLVSGEQSAACEQSVALLWRTLSQWQSFTRSLVWGLCLWSWTFLVLWMYWCFDDGFSGGLICSLTESGDGLSVKVICNLLVSLCCRMAIFFFASTNSRSSG